MRSLHIGLELLKSTGGTTNAVRDFADAMPGSRVLVLCDMEKHDREGPFRLDWNYLPIARNLRGRYYSYPEAAVIEDARRIAQGVDVILCHMLYRFNSNLALRLSRELGVPYYIVPHGSLDPWVLSYRRWQKLLWMRLFGARFITGAKGVIFATLEEARRARSVYSDFKEVVINWPVRLPTARPGGDAARARIRAELRIPPSARVWVYFGRLHSVKRPLETIRLFSDLDALACDHLLVIGPEDDVTRADCVAAAGGAGSRVHVMGPVYGDAKFDHLAAADVFVSFSLKENFNYCMAEAMGCALPVVASAGNCLISDLTTADCGWYSSGDRIDDLREVLSVASAESAAVIARKGANARKYALDRFSFDTFSAKLAALV